MPIPIPLIALGAAYAATLVPRASEEVGPAAPDDTSGDVMPHSIDWNPLIEEMRGEISADFLRRWMERESGGNPCAKGMWGGPWEAGIGQVYFGEDQRHTSQFGVTLDDLRACCYIGSERMASYPTDAQMRANVSSLVMMATKYTSVARNRLSAIGVEWSDLDVQCLAKLYHALPVLVTNHLSVAYRNGMASDWNTYRSYYGNMSREEVIEADLAAGYKAGKGAARFWPLDRLFENAEYTGKG